MRTTNQISAGSGSRAISSYTPVLKEAPSGERYPVVEEFMDRAFVRLRDDMHVFEAIEILLKNGLTGSPVVDSAQMLVGVLSEKDCLHTLLEATYHGLPGGVVGEYMSRDVLAVPQQTDIVTVVSTFTRNSYRRLPVVDHEGRLVGQVTRRDLLRVMHAILRDRKRGLKF